MTWPEKRRTVLAGGPDEFADACDGTVGGEPCRWTYCVARVQPDIDGHDQRRHADAAAAFADHVADTHPEGST